MSRIDDVCVCSVCGIRLVKHEVVDGKIITRFEPFKKDKTVINDDGSYSRYPICLTCDNK